MPEEEIIEEINQVNKKYNNEDLAEDFYKAWDEYNYSFDIDENKYLDRIEEAYFKNIENVGMSDFNATYCLLRDFKRDDKAQEMLDKFSETHDLSKDYTFRQIIDKSLMIKITDLMKSKKKQINYEEIFLSIGVQESWNIEDLKDLSEVSEDKLYEIIYNNPDELHFKAIRFFLKSFIEDDFFKTIMTKITTVLIKISQSGYINKRRIMKNFELDLDSLS